MTSAEPNQAEHDASPGDTGEGTGPRRRRWRELWQVPTLGAASALLLTGIVMVQLSRPAPDVPGIIERARGELERGAPELALAVLNDEARPLLSHGSVTPEIRRSFHALRAMAIAAGQTQLGIDVEANHEQILEEFDKALGLGHEMEDREAATEVSSMLAMGKYDEVAERIGSIGDDAAAARASLYKRSISAMLAASPPREDLATDLLVSFGEQPLLTVDDGAWVIARRTELRMAQGYIEEAIARLLRVMPRMEGASATRRGELLLLLGEAYAESGSVADARKQLDRATSLLSEGDDAFARALLAEGRVLEQSGESDEARLRFERVVASHASSPSYLPALVALGEVLSVLAEIDPAVASHADAVGVYARFVDEVRVQGGEPAAIAEGRRSILARFDEHMARGAYEQSAEYAQLAEDLAVVRDAGIDPRALLAQSTVYRALAEQLAGSHEDEGVGADGYVELAELDPATRAQAQRWFVRAGDYARRHADAIAGSDQDRAYADSVWTAASMFDRGGDTGEAIAAYVEFAGTIDSDPRVAAARFRLARAYQASGEYELAAEQFEALLDEALDPERSGSVGPWGVRSYVPLAEVYLEDPDPSNDERAAELLGAVLRGEAGGVDGDAFGQALTAMGTVHYYEGRHPQAIEHLEEALVREQSERSLNKIRFLLADSYRLESAAIDRTLGEGAIAPSVERELLDTRSSHLLRAIELYGQTRDGYEAMHERRRTAMDEVYLRNAYFYLGDCAFDLGDFERAIRSYQIAKDRYEDDPASLVALVQIFNAYIESGQLEQAVTASEKARRFYERLPEDVWDDPTLPMSRSDWERWLDSSFELASLRASGMDASAGG
ncbi:MAG: tetratricopeptide repeat protein [Planctomycetota bacterium]